MARTKTMAKKGGKKRKSVSKKAAPVKRKHRWRPGTVALRNIKKY